MKLKMKITIYSGCIGVGKITLLKKKKKASKEFGRNNSDILKKTYVDKTLTIEEQISFCQYKTRQFIDNANTLTYKFLDRGPLDPIIFGMCYALYTKNGNMLKVLNKYYEYLKEWLRKTTNEYCKNIHHVIVECSKEVLWKHLNKRGNDYELYDKKFIEFIHQHFSLLMKEHIKDIGLNWDYEIKEIKK